MSEWESQWSTYGLYISKIKQHGEQSWVITYFSKYAGRQMTETHDAW